MKLKKLNGVMLISIAPQLTYSKMSMISVPKSELEYIFNVIGSSLNGTSGPLKLTKSGKPRKESSNKGKPTSHGDFTKKILAEQKEKIAEFKAQHPELKSAHLNFLKIYKEENPQEYETFKAEWALAHPKDSDSESTKSSEHSVTEETTGSEPVAEKPKRTMSDEQKAKMKAGREASAAAKKAVKDAETTPAETTPAETTPAETAPAETEAKAPVATKAVKKAKKAITTEVVTVETSQPQVTELLPFSMGTMNYLRSGVQRSDGNHLWMTGHLWQAKKGLKGPYVGELKNDGTIDQDADEPKA